MGDHEHPEAELLAQLEQQRQDLPADRGVQAGDRLVGDQQVGSQRQRAGDQHPLALAARQLVRVAQEQPLGRPQPGLRQGVGDLLRPRCGPRGRRSTSPCSRRPSATES